MRQPPWIQSSLPFVGMTSAIVALALNAIISKMAMSNGTSFYILSVYSNGLATLILFPTAFLFHRSERPKLFFPVLWRIFVLASFGCYAEIGSYAGINYSSPTLSTSLLILVPAFTYILAIIFRMEEVNWRKLSTIAKSVGTLVSISGAFIVTFYKGSALLNAPLTSGTYTLPYLPTTQDWVLGGLLLASAAIATSAWCILQASILKMYPAEMIVVAFYCFFVTIQSSVVYLIAERDSTAWRIQTSSAFIAVLYSALINIAFRLYVTTWCIWKTGPFFVSLFKPLTVFVAVVVGVIFLKDVLYLGSLIGAAVLIIGFYAVIWGKSKEGEMNNCREEAEAPLLQENIEKV